MLHKLPEAQFLLILAFIVGLVSGGAAVALKLMIELVGDLLIGWFDTTTDSFLYLLYPGLGMLIAMLLVRYLVKDNIGLGVSKVLLAVSKNNSRI